MPSFQELAATITLILLPAFLSGHGERVMQDVQALRTYVLKKNRKPWPCPSIFSGSQACTRWSSGKR